jgi:hypothetical protein
MLGIPREHFDSIKRFEPISKFKKMPMRNDVPLMGHVPLKELKFGDIIRVNMIKVMRDRQNHPVGLSLVIPDIQQYSNVPRDKAPFIPRSFVPLERFNEIAGIVEKDGLFSTIAKYEQDITGRGNIIFSLLLSPAETVPQVPQKPQIINGPQSVQKPPAITNIQMFLRPQAPAKLEIKSPAQIELDHKDLIAGKFVTVQLTDVCFEELKKDTPNKNAIYTFSLCGEKANAKLKFNPHIVKQLGLKLLAKKMAKVQVRRQPPTGKKRIPGPDQQIPLKFDEVDLLLKAKTLFGNEQALKGFQDNQSV